MEDNAPRNVLSTRFPFPTPDPREYDNIPIAEVDLGFGKEGSAHVECEDIVISKIEWLEKKAKELEGIICASTKELVSLTKQAMELRMALNFLKNRKVEYQTEQESND
jgi:hypothetical protein